MGSMSEKISGVGNQIAGKAKQAIGEATGNDRLNAEGKGQEVKGKLQKASGDAKDAVKSAVDRM
ncbi:CsbD family protein [Ensifer soli]|uniref:CsbD family protein n=1 Tax=Ciceribacter sp. sgz301302 TaxID=3342379 RepID=UPI0035B7EAB6